MFRRFWSDERGATAIEYGLIVAVLSLAITAGINQIYGAIEYLFAEPTSALNEAID